MCARFLWLGLLVTGCTAGLAPLASEPTACTPLVTHLACDAPPVIDPLVIHDRDAFIAAASALVCEWGLRGSAGGWESFEQTFCAPGYAAVDAAQNDITTTPPYDQVEGLRCLASLVDAPGPFTAFDAAVSCRALALGLEGRPCVTAGVGPRCTFGADCVEGRCHVARLGEGCSFPSICAPGLFCDTDRCAPLPAIGSACDERHGCGLDLECVDGACALTTPWSNAEACCSSDLDCTSLRCIRGRCAATARHVGCACSTDTECPSDVSRCVGGACVLRPFPGEACTSLGLPCYGSVCGASGRCHAGLVGEGPCRNDHDCATGLLCSGDWWAGPGVCATDR